MLYRQVPKNGDKLSILGFGCMRLPMKDGAIDEARAIAQIRRAIDKGVNYMDSAWPYHGGESEILLGKALKDGYREKVKVATKLPSWMIKSRADMDVYLNAQLKKLGTDHIDYYLLHSLNGESWDSLAKLGVLDFLETAKADGRIVNPGFSFHGTNEDFTRIVDAYPWTFCQIQYNFLDREYQAGEKGLKYAASKKLAVFIMEPLRGGNIGLATPPPPVAEIWSQAKAKRSPAEWALRWIWNQPEATLLLSGMNEESHIDENIAAASSAQAGAFSQEELEIVDRVARKYNELMQVPCTGCGYCMPCPSGVLIPVCFEEFNKLSMFGNVEDSKFRYALRTGGVINDGSLGHASQCVNCGACLEKCPQHIEIPEVLAKAAAALEDSAMPDRIEKAKKLFKVKAK